MHGRTTFVLIISALVFVAGCKSGSANADEVLSERTKQSQTTESPGHGAQGDDETEQTTDEQGASKSVIRLFNEDEVDEDEGGPVEIGGASDDSIKLTVDQSTCKAFASSMTASIEKLDNTCASDADCAVLALPCALGCGRAVRAYSNLDQVEDFAAQYVDECPNCEKMCSIGSDWVATCVEGACVAGPPEAAKDAAAGVEDAADDAESEPDDEAMDSEESQPESDEADEASEDAEPGTEEQETE